jgi:putative spermidine/putrescine transport system ATP-binding protein
MTGQRGTRIILAGVAKAYGTVRAVQGVDLEIEPGEFVTLLGPSGSGKTTLLNVVAGFVAPDAGDVLLDQRSVIGMPPYKRGLGMVFQNYALFPHMTVFDNIAFPLRMRGTASDQIGRAVRRVLEIVQLPDLGARYPHQLSGGQQQRVALARAVVFDPQALLMDEPLGALDKNLREQLQHELRRLHRQLGVTVVYVTHDQQEALALSDRIAVMNHGRIVQIGSGHELYEAPQSEFVAQFLGESNVLEGTMVARRDNVWGVSVEGLEITVPADDPPGGARVRLLLRPERVQIGAENTAGFPGRVEDVTYLGDFSRCVVQLTPGPRLIAKVSGDTPRSMAEGARVVVTWRPQDVRVLSESLDAGKAGKEG